MGAMLQRISDSLSQMVHQQGRYLRGQLFDLGVTLLVIAAGLVLLLAGVIMACITISRLLHLLVGDVWAMTIMSLLMLLGGVALAMAGRQMEVRASRKWHEPPAPASERGSDAHGFGSSQEMQARHQASYREDISTSHSSSIMDQAAMAKEYLHLTEDRLGSKLDIVRRHPIASAGVAMGVGMLLGRSRMARSVVKMAAIAGGKMVIDHLLHNGRRAR